MRKIHFLVVGLSVFLATASSALAQARPYIGYVYPAGGQQGTTFRVTLGGQGLDNVNQAYVSGTGVSAKVIEYRRRLNPQEMQLLGEQLRRLRQASRMTSDAATTDANQFLVEKLRRRMADFVQRPASAATSSLVTVEVTVASDATPGRRELTMVTPRGVSNPLVFLIGQLPEVSRKPMSPAQFQVLGKEELALRSRPGDEAEQCITLPSTLNGQIASGEVNHYRFQARKGQRLVFSAEARELMPFLADASPGWFQPVMALYDASGKEVAYDDDYRFRPDPVILYEVPKDGEYVLTMTDALYRGREDFVYRITAGEVPFITSIFPLGGRVGAAATSQMRGWNLDGAKLMLPAADAGSGIFHLAASKDGFISNGVSFKLDTLPECVEKEPNNDIAHAQKVMLPIIINGRIDHPDDRDVFQFAGHAGQAIVVQVDARRLDSPVDSFLKITDAAGKVLAFNDDYEDPEAGENTHDADSYLTLKPPADGNYYVHLSDTARQGSDDYAYRLRISEPQPDFALRVVPSSVSFRSKSSGVVNVQVIRKDGFQGPIKLTLKDPPAGFSAGSISVPANQTAARLVIKTELVDSKSPLSLSIEGRATIQDRDITHIAIPAEDRMQAFLWRHLVPAQELKVLVFDPNYDPPPQRIPRAFPPTTTRPVTSAPSADSAATSKLKLKFTKQQVGSRLRQLKLLFEEGFLTDEFYHEMVLECEAAR